SIESRRRRRVRSSFAIHYSIIPVSLDDRFAIINCTTKTQVSYEMIDWYFKNRVIWQRGKTVYKRYNAYSPDQRNHFLLINSLEINDTGQYMCLNQNTGDILKYELIVRK
ncbi:unnamed protein product, partial [Didymodactylos carnosus]